uniref:uncharacterized protein LOC125907553 n=1 Tax=Anopheles coluzzii TaxID=1518534 RepID=UPI0020FFBAE6|nr:uncharacterized protein LOC125907553 [Anopheles coluzzii]
MHYAPLCNSVANTDFVDGLHSTGLFQLSGIANQSGRQLDLVFANLAATNILCDSITPLHSVNGTSALENFLPYVTHCSIPLLSEDFHHPSLDIMIYYPVQLSHTTNSHTRSTVYRNFFKTNVERMNALIVSFDRNFDCSNFSTIDEATDCFSVFMRSAINSCVPVAQRKSGPDWSNASLRRLKKIKSKAYADYSRTRSSLHRRIFFDALNNYRRHNRVLYRSFIRRTERQLFSKPTRFWSFWNKRRNISSIPPSMSYNGQTSIDKSDICNTFANCFVDAFTLPVHNPNTLAEATRNTPSDAIDFIIPTIDEALVARTLNDIKPSTSSGPDNIPAYI